MFLAVMTVNQYALMINLLNLFPAYLREDFFYIFINSMIEEIKFCNDIMKKYFNKELGMTKEEDEDFENSSKSWICDNVYAQGVFKVRHHCHITGKSK